MGGEVSRHCPDFWLKSYTHVFIDGIADILSPGGLFRKTRTGINVHNKLRVKHIYCNITVLVAIEKYYELVFRHGIMMTYQYSIRSIIIRYRHTQCVSVRYFSAAFKKKKNILFTKYYITRHKDDYRFFQLFHRTADVRCYHYIYYIIQIRIHKYYYYTYYLFPFYTSSCLLSLNTDSIYIYSLLVRVDKTFTKPVQLNCN